MKITKRQLRRIIKETILRESAKMIDIVTNAHEDVEDINILANYALNNDMQGALNDESLKYYIEFNEATYLVDDSHGWLPHVGDEEWNMPAPEGWDLEKVQAFFRDFEDEAFKVFSKKEQGDHASLPAKKEREIIGQALSQQYVMPDEIKGLEFQVRRKGGKPSSINIEDDNTVSNIRAEDTIQQGLTLDDIINVLRDGGAKERSKQRPVKHTPPMYD
jgi:hypothetical protein